MAKKPSAELQYDEDQNILTIKGGTKACGIGVVLDVNPCNGLFFIKRVVEGGSAWLAGVHQYDTVISVDGKELKGMTKDELPPLIVGPMGSYLHLTLIPNEGAEESKDHRSIRIQRNVDTARVQFSNTATAVRCDLSEECVEMVNFDIEGFLDAVRYDLAYALNTCMRRFTLPEREFDGRRLLVVISPAAEHAADQRTVEELLTSLLAQVADSASTLKRTAACSNIVSAIVAPGNRNGVPPTPVPQAHDIVGMDLHKIQDSLLPSTVCPLSPLFEAAQEMQDSSSSTFHVSFRTSLLDELSGEMTISSESASQAVPVPPTIWAQPADECADDPLGLFEPEEDSQAEEACSEENMNLYERQRSAEGDEGNVAATNVCGECAEKCPLDSDWEPTNTAMQADSSLCDHDLSLDEENMALTRRLKTLCLSSENEAPSCMAHVGRAIYEAQKLEQQLKAEEVAEADEAGTPPGPPLQQHLPQVEQPSDGDVERRLPIIVDVVPGQVGGFKGKKLLVPEQTSVALLARVIRKRSLLSKDAKVRLFAHGRLLDRQLLLGNVFETNRESDDGILYLQYDVDQGALSPPTSTTAPPPAPTLLPVGTLPELVQAIAVAVDCAKSARKLDQQTHTIIISSGDRRPAFTDSANVTAASLMSAPKTPFAKAFDRGINWALGDEDGVDASVTNSTFRLDLPSPSDNVPLCNAIQVESAKKLLAGSYTVVGTGGCVAVGGGMHSSDSGKGSRLEALNPARTYLPSFSSTEAAAPASNDKENCSPALVAISEEGPSRCLYSSAPTGSTALGSAMPFLGAGIVGQGRWI